MAAGAGTGGSFSGVAGQVDGNPSGGAPVPVQPHVLVSVADFNASYVSGPATSGVISVTDLPFTQAWRASMQAPPATAWDAQLIVPLDQAVSAGDLLNVSFWVRCETPGPSGDCTTEFIFERASDPWEKSVAFATSAGVNWVEQSQFFSLVSGYGPGEAHMLFRLGYPTQVIDIGGVVVQRIPAH